MTEHAFAGPGADQADAEVQHLPLRTSPLESLRAAVNAMHDAGSQLIKLPHPGASHIELHFNRKTVSDYDNLAEWRKGSQNDQELFGCTLLKESNTAIVVDGTDAGITLGSAELCEVTGNIDPLAAIKSFFDDNFLWISSLVSTLVAEAASDPSQAPRSTS